MRQEIPNSEYYGPWRQLYCRDCGFAHIHQCASTPLKDKRTWLRIILSNWWENGWKVKSREGELIPIGYGIGWQCVNELAIILFPVPLNLVMRYGREFYCWMMRGGWKRYPSVEDRINHEVAKRLRYVENKG